MKHCAFKCLKPISDESQGAYDDLNLSPRPGMSNSFDDFDSAIESNNPLDNNADEEKNR